MMTVRHLLAATLLAGALPLAPGAAEAAQSYDNCTDFVDSLPATITTQGTWCLRKDLSTNITSGNAITIAANNVTLDCNDFKIGGLSAGDASQARGIYATQRQNVTIRHCAIRGFFFGVSLDRGSGHLVEDNHLDNNLVVGISFHNYSANSSVIRNNRVMDTGGAPGYSTTYGISASGALIEGNLVAGVFADSASPKTTGIRFLGDGVVRGNLVRIANSLASGNAVGINATSTKNAVEKNVVLGTGNVYPSTGIIGALCRDNTATWVKTGEDCASSIGYQGW